MFLRNPWIPGIAFALLVAAISVSPLRAGLQVDYTNLEDNANDYDTSGANNPLTLNVGGTDTATQSGDLTGTGGIVKIGAGSLTLTGSNTYAGNTTLNAGTLRLSSLSSFGNGDGILTINGGALGNAAVDDVATIFNNVVVTQDFAIDAQGVASGTVEFVGDVDLGAAATRTITLTSDGLACFGGILSGQNLAFVTTAPASKAMFCDTASNTFTGTLRVGSGVSLELLKVADGIAISGNLQVDAGGSVLISNEGQFAPTSHVTINGSAHLSQTSGTNTFATLSGAGAISADADFADANTLEVKSGAFDGTLTENGGTLKLSKTGSGILTLTGASHYTGGTGIDGGTLVVNGSITGSALAINAAGTLAGDGAVGALTVANDGTISPGSSGPGTLTSGTETWEAGGTYVWEINDAIGLKGSATDWLSINGGLALNTSTGNPFTIKITSLTLADSLGLAANFDPAFDYAWIIATAASPITGFDATHFFIDTTGFANAPGSNRFTLSTNGADLQLTYIAVPEPAVFGLALAVGLALILFFRARRLA